MWFYLINLVWIWCLCSRGPSCTVSSEQINQEQPRQQHEPSGGAAERPEFTTLLGQDVRGAAPVSVHTSIQCHCLSIYIQIAHSKLQDITAELSTVPQPPASHSSSWSVSVKKPVDVSGKLLEPADCLSNQTTDDRQRKPEVCVLFVFLLEPMTCLFRITYSYILGKDPRGEFPGKQTRLIIFNRCDLQSYDCLGKSLIFFFYH